MNNKISFQQFSRYSLKTISKYNKPILSIIKKPKQSFVFKNRRFLLMVLLFAENVKRKIMISKKNVFLYIMLIIYIFHIFLFYKFKSRRYMYFWKATCKIQGKCITCQQLPHAESTSLIFLLPAGNKELFVKMIKLAFDQKIFCFSEFWQKLFDF